MVEGVEIRDEGSLRVWLEAAPQSEKRAWSVYIASRATARVAPILWTRFSRSKERDLEDLRIWRCVFAPRAASRRPDRGVATLKAAAGGIGAALVEAGDPAAAAADAALATARSATYTEHDAPAFAAAACAASARSAGSSEVWSAIRTDVEYLQQGGSVEGSQPLWGTGALQWATESWQEVKRALESTAIPENWEFWIDFYEAELSGTPVMLDHAADFDFLAEIFEVGPTSLLAEGDWDEGGKHVNPIILSHYLDCRSGLGYAAGAKAKRGADPAELLMAESLMQAAIADFGFDTVRKLMTMQPFAQDLALIQDDASRDAFLEAAEEMREDIERFADGLRREGGSMQGAGLVSTELEALLEEFSKARQLNKLNVGKIVKFGEFLQSATLDKSTRDEFGALATRRLEQIVDGVLGLVKSYFGRALMRYAPLDELELEPGTSAWEYLNELRNALRDMRDETDPLGMTPLAPEDIAVLDAIAAEIERVMVAEASADGPAKSSLQREINHKLALLTVSISLYASRARQHEGRLGPYVDDLLKQVRRAKGLGALWVVIKRVLGLE